MKNRIFKGIVKVYFWCGVNVIGLPTIHAHELAVYKQAKTVNKWT